MGAEGGRMAGKHHEGRRAGCCDQADGSCAGLAVQRLSRQRVAELAEEIWTASTGSLLPARSSSDPRSSRPGASARAAYRRCHQQELEAWRPGWWRAGAGYLVLHDVTLPGWPASLDHLVVGATGVWVIESRRGRLTPLRKATSSSRAGCDVAGLVRGLRWEVAAITDALAGDTSIRVRSLRHLADVVRQGSPPPPPDVQRVAARALEVLRPAA
jgi:Nuclease-related domain